jgi:hypothetical protein
VDGEKKGLFGRTSAPAPPPASAGALPNAPTDDSSDGGAPQNPLTGAVWARRSHKTPASSGSAPFPASPLGGARQRSTRPERGGGRGRGRGQGGRGGGAGIQRDGTGSRRQGGAGESSPAGGKPAWRDRISPAGWGAGAAGRELERGVESARRGGKLAGVRGAASRCGRVGSSSACGAGRSGDAAVNGR